MDLQTLLASASEAQVRLALSNVLLGLADLGFGTDEPINGGDAVQSIAAMFDDTVGRCLAAPAPAPVPTEAPAARVG